MIVRAFAAVLFVAAGLLAPGASAQKGPVAFKEIPVQELPKEARDVLALIHKGGPFPYAKDGVVFGNFE